MRRNMDLIRELLLKLEALNLRGGMAVISGYDEQLAVDGFDAEAIDFHLQMLRKGDLLDSPGSQPGDGGITFRSLSWDGADFLDTVRDPETWAKTKKGAMAAGGFTLDLLKDWRRVWSRSRSKNVLVSNFSRACPTIGPAILIPTLPIVTTKHHI